MNFFGRSAAPAAKPRVSATDTAQKMAKLEADVETLEKKERHTHARIIKKENDVRKLLASNPPQKERARREFLEVKSLKKQLTATGNMITRARQTLTAISIARDQIMEMENIKERTKMFKAVTGDRDITGEMEEAIADNDEVIADADEMLEAVAGSGMAYGVDEDELDAEMAELMGTGAEVTAPVAAAPAATAATPMTGLPAMPGLPAATTTPAMPVAPTAAATAAPAAADSDFAGLEDLMG